MASACVSYLEDMKAKVKKAKDMKGARFINIFSPCVPGWGYDPAITVKLGKLAVESGLWKLFEIENGKYRETYKPAKLEPVKEYFKLQKRFKHLTDEEIAEIQKMVEEKL